ncbi:hypothetical protein [Clavibacter zhangzhiyongii]|uniref:hypothetical protein n=1 Tax=Clavibacter zhangzhiyongii TaxID=2768071 RepID=UPI0039E18F86
MDTWGLVVSIVAAVATIAAAVIAAAQARIAMHARDDARKAQAGSESAAAESVALARKANDAFERQARAQEEANQLARANLPADEVRWTYRHIAGMRYVLTNAGTRIARAASIEDITEPSGWVQPEEPGPCDVRPGDSLEFMVVTAWGSPRPEFRVTWTEDGSDEVFTDDTRMVIS